MISSISGSKFLRHVGVLAGGQGFAAIIPLLAAPVLSRLYTPAEYGVLAVYMSFAGLVALAAHLQYRDAVVVQRTERRAMGVLAVCMCCSVAVAAVTFVLAAAFAVLVGDGEFLGVSAGWLVTLPAIALLVGVGGSLTSLAIRRENFRFVGGVLILGAAISASVAILLGIMEFDEGGLILSYIAQHLAIFLVYVIVYREDLKKIPVFDFRLVVKTALKNSQFPRFGLPTNVIRNLAQSIPLYGLAFVGAVDLVGHLSRAQAFLSMPMNLVGGAMGRVFHQRASRAMARDGSFFGIYRRLLFPLTALAPLAIIAMAALAPPFFVFYLGPQWEQTGQIAQLLAPLIALRFIAGPFWGVFGICDAMDVDFYISVFQVFALVILLAFVLFSGADPFWMIVAHVVAGCCVALLQIVSTYRLASGRPVLA